VSYSEGVVVPGAGASGETAVLKLPVVVRVALAGVSPGRLVALYFNVIGPDSQSRVVIDTVQFRAGPALEFALDPAFDSGVQGDDLTNWPTIGLVGTTDPLQLVTLDLDGDGFDDGSVTADGTGQFQFAGIVLEPGDNRIRLRAVNASGAREVERVIRLDDTAPTLVGLEVNGGEAQRSRVTSLALVFTEDVFDSLGAGSLSLRNTTTGETLAPSALEITRGAGNRVMMTFPTLPAGSLPDGNYTLTIVATRTADAAGNAFDGDGDGIGGDDGFQRFFRYFGDTDGDRDVDFLDTYWFQRTYGRATGDAQYATSLDVNQDGVVDATDRGMFQAHYLSVLAPEMLPPKIVLADPQLGLPPVPVTVAPPLPAVPRPVPQPVTQPVLATPLSSAMAATATPIESPAVAVPSAVEPAPRAQLDPPLATPGTALTSDRRIAPVIELTRESPVSLGPARLTPALLVPPAWADDDGSTIYGPARPVIPARGHPQRLATLQAL